MRRLRERARADRRQRPGACLKVSSVLPRFFVFSEKGEPESGLSELPFLPFHAKRGGRGLKALKRALQLCNIAIGCGGLNVISTLEEQIPLRSSSLNCPKGNSLSSERGSISSRWSAIGPENRIPKALESDCSSSEQSPAVYSIASGPAASSSCCTDLPKKARRPRIEKWRRL